MVTYLNWRGPAGRETVDEVRGARKERMREVARLLAEYRMAGFAGIYASSRPCRNWSE